VPPHVDCFLDCPIAFVKDVKDAGTIVWWCQNNVVGLW